MPTATAAPKAGQACSKPGITKNYQGKKYTCIYKSKKLIWNKGVAIKKPAEQAAPIQPPAATGPAKPITLDNLDSAWTYKEAHKLVLAEVKLFDSAKLGIRYVLGPTSVQARVDEEKQGIDRIAGLWSNYFVPDNVRFIYVTPRDGDWADDLVKIENLSPMLPPGSGLKKLITTNECMFALGGRPNGIYTNIQCLPDRIHLASKQTGPHEYTHFVQFYSGNMPGKAACWVIEGMATFYGNAIGFSMEDPTGAVRNNWFSGFAWSYGSATPNQAAYNEFNQLLRRGNPAEITTIMKLLEATDCSQRTGPTTVQIGYLLGGMAWEALVASYGHQSVVDYLKDFTKTQDWRASFKNVYGLTVDEFYLKLAPYIASQVKW